MSSCSIQNNVKSNSVLEKSCYINEDIDLTYTNTQT
jgi:hypothetical protein